MIWGYQHPPFKETSMSLNLSQIDLPDQFVTNLGRCFAWFLFHSEAPKKWEVSAETNHSKHMSIQPKPSLCVVYIYIYGIILPSETSGFFNNPIYKESLQKKKQFRISLPNGFMSSQNFRWVFFVSSSGCHHEG